MIRVYLTNLALYNEGTLHGEWLELPATEEEIAEAVERVLYRDGDEEYFLSDYETEYPIKVGEYDNLTELNDFADSLLDWENRHGADVIKAVIAATDFTTYGELVGVFEDERFDVYHDVWSYEDLGLVVCEDGYLRGVKIPEALEVYIDYEAIGRDMETEGWTIVGGIAVRTW